LSRELLTREELLELEHNDHEWAFDLYLNQSRHTQDKQNFLFEWVRPSAGDVILECGSSSGKTSIDFARKSHCRVLGVDFDERAQQVATSLRDRHFPELTERCQFVCDDLESMRFPAQSNKVLMPDFSEHIPDRVFTRILDNLAEQLPNARLYIYTPLRSHLFEILKHRNILLKNPSGHINVKTRKELVSFLERNGWQIESIRWRESAIPIFRHIEKILGQIPGIGALFQRRIAIIARPSAKGQ